MRPAARICANSSNRSAGVMRSGGVQFMGGVLLIETFGKLRLMSKRITAKRLETSAFSSFESSAEFFESLSTNGVWITEGADYHSCHMIGAFCRIAHESHASKVILNAVFASGKSSASPLPFSPAPGR